MNILKTSMGITRTIRNVNRMRQIIQTLARNGLNDLIIKSGVLNLVPDVVLPKAPELQRSQQHSSETWVRWLGRSLAKSFEELGPGFIKLGQNLATRDDLLPRDFIDEMRRLQDSVKGIEFTEAMKILSDCLACPIDEVFAEIDQKPIGNASIGVVYKARMHSGEKVVIKLRRPDVVKQVESDGRLFASVVQQLERVSKELQYLNLSRVVESFTDSMIRELDFNVERFNSQKLSKIYQSHDQEDLIVCPRVYDEYCSDRMLVMQMLEGIPFSNQQEIKKRMSQIEGGIHQIITIIFKSIFIDGFFHGDPHGGNLLLLDDNRIGVLDFGLCGSISRNSAISLISVLHALSRGDFENMCYELLDAAEFDEIPDTAALVFDAKEALGPYIGLELQDIDSSIVVQKIISILAKYRIYLPRDWMMLLRSIITLDGLGKSLEVKLDIFAVIEEVSHYITSQFLSREALLSETYWLSRSLLSTVRVIPRHIKWYLKEFANRNYGFEIIHRNLDGAGKNIKSGFVFLGYSLIVSSLIISGSMLSSSTFSFSSFSQPTGGIILWLAAFALFIKALYVLR